VHYDVRPAGGARESAALPHVLNLSLLRHIKDVIAIAQLEALDSTTSERGHEPDVAVVAGGELTVSAPSLSGVRWRPGFHLAA
jgi:hypothetical protein